MLALCWPMLALACPMLTLCWPKLTLSCPYVDPMFAYVALANANPHSSDRNGGGDDAVGRGWVLTLAWPMFALSCPMLTLYWPKLTLSYPYLDPMFAYVVLANANPHSSDRNDGGDDAVGRGWVFFFWCTD